MKVKLKNFIEIVENGTRDKGGAVKKGIPSLGAEHLNSNGTINWSIEKMKYISFELFNKMKTGIMKKDDVLIVKDGATTGKVAYVDDIPYNYSAINEHVFLLRPKKELLPKYLFYYLASKEGKQKVLFYFRGATVGGITKDFLNIDIPLTSISEQKKIANILDKVTNLIELRKKQLEKLDIFSKTLFVEMFGNLILNNKKWKIRNFKEVATIDTKMITDFTNYIDYPHIGIENIEKNTGNLKNYISVGESNLKSGKYIFSSKHIIYSKIRPNLNKVALPNFYGLCSADAYPILPNNNICNRIYLGYVMRQKIFLNYILAFSSRTNLPKVNKKQIEGFSLPIPPIELQNQFAKKVEHIDKIKLSIQDSLTKLETLKKSLMQEYFS